MIRTSLTFTYQVAMRVFQRRSEATNGNQPCPPANEASCGAGPTAEPRTHRQMPDDMADAIRASWAETSL